MEDNEPNHHEPDLWPAYLAFYRDQTIDAVLALDEGQRRTSVVPSGWTPIELLSHVLHMEQRWFVWGFLGEQVDDVWGDWTVDEPWADDADGRWQVADEVSAEQLAARLRTVGERTTRILAEHPRDAVAAAGERFDGDPATLEWICFHVLQEYARHAGHLDIVVELGGRTGQ
ncbi:MAG: DUF664 domain-containing protein [Nocardioides sp.]